MRTVFFQACAFPYTDPERIQRFSVFRVILQHFLIKRPVVGFVVIRKTGQPGQSGFGSCESAYKACKGNSHEHKGKGTDRFPVLYNSQHPVFQSFPGHRHPGRHHTDTGHAFSCRCIHKYIGIVFSFLFVHCLCHTVIATQFAVCPAHRCCQPDKRIKPVNCAAKHPQNVPDMIPVFQMADFMCQHIFDILRGCNYWQDDKRTENAYQTGAGNRIREVNRNRSDLPLLAHVEIHFLQST